MSAALIPLLIILVAVIANACQPVVPMSRKEAEGQAENNRDDFIFFLKMVGVIALIAIAALVALIHFTGANW